MYSLINFELKHPNDILPFGREPQLSLSWFGLTDSFYWLDVGNVKLYEYSELFLEKHKDCSRYVDYYLSRFIEDFTEKFEMISESIPDYLYEIVKNYETLAEFKEYLRIYVEIEKQKSDDEDFWDDKYYEQIKWISSRQVFASHLIEWPVIGFFRNNSKISIVWNADYETTENIQIWAAGNGQYELDYSEFLHQIEDFRMRFFHEMNKQVEMSIAKDWGDIKVDKMQLIKENRSRKIIFDNQYKLLSQPIKKPTNWSVILQPRRG